MASNRALALVEWYTGARLEKRLVTGVVNHAGLLFSAESVYARIDNEIEELAKRIQDVRDFQEEVPPS